MSRIVTLTALFLVLLTHPSSVTADTADDDVRFDGWTEERYREYEDSILAELYPPCRLVHVDVDETEVIPGAKPHVTVSGTLDQKDSSIDTSKEPGEIRILSGVSNTGARTYEIPVGVTPGVNGMQPAISLSYNSQRGSSIAGHGWSVSGLPMITRGVNSIYYDGRTRGVSMDNDDSFSLDGMRLVRTGGDDNEILYESVLGNIKARGFTTGGEIYRFEVYYPDGRRGFFGSLSYKSRLYYPAISLSDRFGNIMSFSYTEVENHFRIDRIIYGRHSVTFEYDYRADPLLWYEGGRKVIEDKQLQHIVHKTGSDVLWTYTLEYTTRSNVSLLTRVGYSSGGRSCNPLTFHYGDGDSESDSSYETYTTRLLDYFDYEKPGDIIVSRGKFDYASGSDGLIIYPNRNPYWKHYQKSNLFSHAEHKFVNCYSDTQEILLYAGLENGHVLENKGLVAEEGLVDILCADLEGKQGERIVKINNKVENKLDVVTFKVYGTSIAGGTMLRYTRTYGFNTVYTDKRGNRSIQPKYYFPGDFDGDGRMEILAISAHEPFGDTSKPSICYVFDLENDRILYESHLLDYNVEFLGTQQDDPAYVANHSDRLIVLDYDGDGKTDICHIHGRGTDVYTFDTDGNGISARKVAGSAQPTKYDFFDRDIFPGEYNGDGKMDILVSHSTAAGQEPGWILYNSMGNGLFDKSTFDGPARVTADNYGLLAQDINGDGKTDMLSYRPGGFSTYLTDRNRLSVTHFYTEYANDIPILVPTDINSRNSFTKLVGLDKGTVTLFSFSRNDSKDILSTGMTNSLGVTERTIYQTLTDDSERSGFYTQGYGATYPYVNMKEPLPVVSECETYVNGQLTESREFSYTNAVIHRQGLGFCGFQEIHIEDERGGSSVRTFAPYDYCTLLREKTLTHDRRFAYSVKTDSRKVTRICLDSKTEENLLTGEYSETTFAYDPYGYPTEENTEWSDGINVKVTKSYSSQTDAGEGYHVGLLREETRTITNGDNTCTERMVIPSTHKLRPSMIVRYRNDKQTEMVQCQYDGNGNMTSRSVRTYADGTALTTAWTYDDNGCVITETDPLGLVTEYTYDARLNPLTVKDCRGGLTTYAYDAFGREKSVIYPDNTCKDTNHSWSSGSPDGVYAVTTLERDGSRTVSIFDALGRKVRETGIGFDGEARKTDMAYDARGNLVKRSLPYTGSTASHWDTYSYDIYDRIFLFASASGKRKEYTYDGTSVTTVTDGVSETRDYDSQGNVISVSDPGGIITYNLKADGQPEAIVAPGGIATTFDYDPYGRKAEVFDPSLGRMSYTYDFRGNLASETDGNGKTIRYHYDAYDRMVGKVTPEMSTSYTYDRFGQLTSVTTDNGTATEYTYDRFGRLVSKRETVSGVSLNRSYTYSGANVSSIRYSTGGGLSATENLSYAYGHLVESRDGSGNILYRLVSENSLGQPTEVITGDVRRRYTYSPYGLPTGRSASSPSEGTIQDISYAFDHTRSNLMWRRDNTRGLTEQFRYDGLNRLVGHGDRTVGYDDAGNIRVRSEIGTFSYGHPAKPYAITGVSPRGDAIPAAGQAISYSSFSRPLSIVEDTTTLRFTYNGDYDRVKMETVIDGKTAEYHYYLGGCYEKISSRVEDREILWLNGDFYDSPVAIIRSRYNLAGFRDPILIPIDDEPIVVNGGNTSSTNSSGVYLPRLGATVYVLRDYLGSITHITTASGKLVGEYSYDAWGRMRDPATLTCYPPGAGQRPYLGRGFTGHEHLMANGLINMNARLYDPALGRFLSPDPWIQMPFSTQNFNRYTYAMNNPLCYVDENGEFFWFAIGVAAVVGAAINVGTHWDQIKAAGGGWKGFWKGASYALAGAAAGAVGTAAGFWAAAGLGGMYTITAYQFAAASTGFWNGAAIGTTSGLVGGFINGTSNSIIKGENIGEALYHGGMEGVSGAFMGGMIGGFYGGIRASMNGRDFWSGKLTNRTLVQRSANVAEQNIGGSGHAAGSRKHKYASDMIRRYQNSNGDMGLVTKEFMEDELKIRRIPDIIDYKNSIIYDFKFGYPGKTPAMLNNTPQMIRYRELWEMNSEIIKPKL